MNRLAPSVREPLMMKDAYRSRNLCMLPSDPLAGIKALVFLWVVLLVVGVAAQTLLAMIMS